MMRANRPKSGFTVIELMTVITIIVLVLAMAVPVVRSVEGNRSLEAGYNRIAAALGHARQIALYYRAPAGVAFYKLPNGLQTMAFVMQEKNIAADAQNSPQDDRYMDIIPGEEIITLPAGLAVQVITNLTVAAPLKTERYLRAGIVLFDENGQLATSTPYWIRGGTQLANGITGIPTALIPTGTATLYSHQAISLYDDEAYEGQVDSSSGFTFNYIDASISNPMSSITYANYFLPPTPPSNAEKTAEQNWLDANGQILVIKPNDGSLLKNQ
jgi:prepilin-type N-terminal cleavage/methylation domain-containing protein